jgi:molybdate transport system regulatory protein
MTLPLKVRSKFWIVDEQGRPLFGQGRRIILEKIEELGSIKAAAEDLKMSYRAVWGKIKTTEERLGLKLVETTPGGGRNRGTNLTPAARQLLKVFQQMHEQGNLQADALFQTLIQGRFKPDGKKS